MLKKGSTSHPGNHSWLLHVACHVCYLPLANTGDVKPGQTQGRGLSLWCCAYSYGAGRTNVSWLWQMFLPDTRKHRLPPSLALLLQETNFHLSSDCIQDLISSGWQAQP